VDEIRELNSMMMVATSGQIKRYRQKNKLHCNVFYFKKKFKKSTDAADIMASYIEVHFSYLKIKD